MAKDAAKVASHIYKVLFENERVRMLDLSGGKVRFTAPSGETAEVKLPTGASTWREAEEHSTENVGGTAIHALFCEPK